MRRFLSAGFILALLLVLLTTTVSANQSVPEDVLASAESVVRIVAEYKNGYATGSGFIIHSDKASTLVATNNHVVADSPLSISIWLDTDEMISAKILTANEQKDLCILELAYPISLAALRLNSQDIKQGDAVYAVGYPAAADILSETEAHTSSEATITDGIVSAIRQNKVTEYGSPLELLQINAAINSGNSGGPLFNAQGEVVGINTFGVFDSQGIFGSISVAELENMMIENGIEVVRNMSGIPEVLIYIGAGILFVCSATVIAFIIRKRHMKKRVNSEPSETLKFFLESRSQPLAPNEAVAMLMPLANDLKGLHETGVAHLEVAPERILVTQGIAKLVEKTGVETNRYSNGFCAPEIYRGKSYGTKTDIYSFCAVLQYAITGVQPENALSRNEEATEETEELLIDSAEELQDSDKKELLDIISQGMRLNADERFASMQELIYKLTPHNFHSTATAENAIVPVETQTVPQASTRKQNKSKVKIWIPVGIATVFLLAVGTYFGCYLKAVSLAEDGEFTSANKFVLIEPLTALHDVLFPEYLEAGIEFENRQYANAQNAFQDIRDYRNSGEMAQESKYRYAAQLADSNEFTVAITAYKSLAGDGYKDSADLVLETRYRKAVYDLFELEEYNTAYTAFSALSKEGFSKADDMCDEAQYWWAFDLIEQEDYVAAYEKLQGIRGYEDVNDTIALLKDVIYAEGQQLYYDEDYDNAETMFECVNPYQNSDDYLTLISAHTRYSGILILPSLGGNTKTVDEIVNDLIDIFYFEDAADLLVSRNSYACRFLLGTWKTSGGSYYFKMEESSDGEYDYYSSYNLPWYGGSFSIEDGVYYVTTSNGTEKAQYAFYLLTQSSMEVYCYKNGSTYTLYRQ